MKPGTSVMFEPASNCVLSYGLECMWMMAWLICMSCDENAGNICVTFVIELIHMAMLHSSSNEGNSMMTHIHHKSFSKSGFPGQFMVVGVLGDELTNQYVTVIVVIK